MNESDPRFDVAWQALYRAQVRVQSVLDLAFNDAGLPGTDVFSALRELQKSEETSAKDLEDALLMPQYGVSRLLSRMERQGLIKRTTGKQDHRQKVLQITAKGRSNLAAMGKTYHDVLSSFFSARAKPGQLERMAKLLELLDSDPA
ncbi:MAG: MarR family winged helix-turn-helix transcriptional regulator [Pseudomonadota bacterium]